MYDTFAFGFAVGIAVPLVFIAVSSMIRMHSKPQDGAVFVFKFPDMDAAEIDDLKAKLTEGETK